MNTTCDDDDNDDDDDDGDDDSPLNTTCHTNSKIFLGTKLLENLPVAKYVISAAAAAAAALILI